jgi:hypothetical protein
MLLKSGERCMRVRAKGCHGLLSQTTRNIQPGVRKGLTEVSDYPGLPITGVPVPEPVLTDILPHIHETLCAAAVVVRYWVLNTESWRSGVRVVRAIAEGLGIESGSFKGGIILIFFDDSSDELAFISGYEVRDILHCKR